MDPPLQGAIAIAKNPVSAEDAIFTMGGSLFQLITMSYDITACTSTSGHAHFSLNGSKKRCKKASWSEKSFRYFVTEKFSLQGGLFSLKKWGNELVHLIFFIIKRFPLKRSSVIRGFTVHHHDEVLQALNPLSIYDDIFT